MLFDGDTGSDCINECNCNHGTCDEGNPIGLKQHGKSVQQKNKTNQQKDYGCLPVIGLFVHGFPFLFGCVQVCIVQKESLLPEGTEAEYKGQRGNQEKNQGNNDFCHGWIPPDPVSIHYIIPSGAGQAKYLQ